MRLRGINFGYVFNSSGARGFCGEGYWFHRWCKPFGLDYTGSTFVAKTTTLAARPGNMALTSDFQPKHRLPDCIVVKFRQGVALNAVGLSGPGVHVLVNRWRQKLFAKPFMVSIMSAAPTVEERLQEIKGLVGELESLQYTYPGGFGVQLNVSCPNVGWHLSNDFTEELETALSLLSVLNVPVLVKVNALFPIEVLHRVCSAHPACDGVVVSNTIPWGSLPVEVDWRGLFGSMTSPLARYGGGGLSGAPLLPIVVRWIQTLRDVYGFKKAIVGGGGVLTAADAVCLVNAGVDAIELGSVAFLRPWRVQRIIQYINKRFRA